MKKHYPEGDINDPQNQIGISIAQTTIQVLKQAGNELTRQNIIKQAANLKDLELPLLLPGIKINTGPDQYYPITQQQLIKFDGKSWVRFGDSADCSGCFAARQVSACRPRGHDNRDGSGPGFGRDPRFRAGRGGPGTTRSSGQIAM